MSAVRILIVEDEIIIAENMAMRLYQEGYEITACVASCEEALKSVKADPPDLVFLDIKLAGGEDGIETARKLQQVGDFPIIFLTNLYDDQTVRRAQAVKPANYLLKPFSQRQLHVSIQRALYHLDQETSPTPGDNSEPDQSTAVYKKNIFIRDKNGTYRKYSMDEILFIEADRSYAFIHTEKGEKLTQSLSMNKLWEKIKHPGFMQVHRSYIVNTEKIDALKGNVLLIGKHEIPVSESHREELLKKIHLVR